jgi:hypothetical protein
VKTIRERFESKFFVDDSGCWVWLGARKAISYGHFRVDSEKTDYAHRVSYRIYKGAIPEGLVIDHLCRKTLCVNPDHLEATTQLENILRSERTHVVCEHGRGYSRCKICLASYARSLRRRNKLNGKVVGNDNGNNSQKNNYS